MDHSDAESEGAARNVGESVTAASPGSALVPWAATAEARRAGADRSGRGRMVSVLASIALGVAGLGLGAAAANLVFSRGRLFAITGLSTQERVQGDRPTASEAPDPRVTEALGTLKSEIAELRATITRDNEARSSAMARKLDELAVRMDRAKDETSGSIALLAAKIDPFRQEAKAELQSLAGRLDQLEHRSDTMIAAPARPSTPVAESPAPSEPVKAVPSAGPIEAVRRPPVIRGWILREVYDGLALVEGADGPIEVAPGELLPGAGRVKSIERSGRGWIVVTSRGVIDGTRGALRP